MHFMFSHHSESSGMQLCNSHTDDRMYVCNKNVVCNLYNTTIRPQEAIRNMNYVSPETQHHHGAMDLLDAFLEQKKVVFFKNMSRNV